MTAARLKASPSDGHGLTSALCDRLFAARQRGESVGDIVTVTVWRPVGTGEHDTAKGTHRHVQFEAIRLEPLNDDVDRLRMVAEDAYQARTGSGGRVLPLNFGDRPDEERRLELIEAIEAWAATQNLTGRQLEETWREHFGIGQGAEGGPGDYHKAALVHVLDFAHSVGAVADEIEGDDDFDDSDVEHVEDDEAVEP